MSLYKQLTILITTFLILMITVVLWFILSHNKEMISNQINSNAKNSASFLGLSISQNVEIEDIATIEGMITSIVDTGFYEYIAVYDVDENEIIKVNGPREVSKSPIWFSKVFSIDAVSTTSNIMKGWSNAGILEVKVHQDYANNQMWIAFKSIAQIFLISTFLLLILFYLFINKLLQPLKKLSIQAKAIDNNEFIIENDLPKTVEFKNVALAMNKTISKMESIFNKEVETLNKYNELLYKDQDTGLGNKNYLILKLNSFLKNSHGLLFFIDIKNEISFKKKIGFKNYMAFKTFIINRINQQFSSNKDMIICKLNDGVLSTLLPNTHYEDIKVNIDNLYADIVNYAKEEKIYELFDLNIAIGISNYVQNTSLKDILSKADQSLSIAMNKEDNKINYLEKDVKFTKQEWIELLQWAFENDGLLFESQKILDITVNKAVMNEYYTRLKDSSGNIYSSGDFWSVVSSMGWLEQLEKQTIDKIFNEKQNVNQKDNSVINLTSDFVSNKSSVNWLIKKLEKFDNLNTTFYFECINADILHNLDDYKYFVEEISKTKHKFAIESFTFDNENLDYLKVLKPEYIKISKSYLVGENKITDNILLNITSTIGSYLIVKHVETKNEFDELKSIGIKYLQGKYIDTLEVVDAI